MDVSQVSGKPHGQGRRPSPRAGHRNQIILAVLATLVLLIIMPWTVGAQEGPGDLTREIRVTADTEGSYLPEVVVGMEDEVHLLWLNGSQMDSGGPDVESGQIFYEKISRYGNVLVPKKKVMAIYPGDGEDFRTSRPSMDVGPSGDLHVTWADDHEGHWTVYYMRLGPDGDLEYFVNGITNDTSARSPVLDVDRTGQVHMAWAQWELFGEHNPWPNIYYMVLGPDGNTTIPRMAVTTTFLGSNNPALVVDQGLRSHIFFEENVNLPGYTDEIYYSVVDDQGETEISMMRISHNKGSSLNPHATVDQIGRPHVVWTDGGVDSSMDIYYSRIDDTTDISTVRVSSTTGDSLAPRIVMGMGMDSHIVWSQKVFRGPVDNSQIWYSMVNDDLEVETEPMALTSEGAMAEFPSPTTDSNNNLIVAWQDYRKQDEGEHKAWDIYYIRNVKGVNLEPLDVLEVEGKDIVDGEIKFRTGDRMVLHANNSTDPNQWDEVVSYNFKISQGNLTITSGWTPNDTFIYEFEETGTYVVFVKVMDGFGYKNSRPQAILVRVLPHDGPSGSSILDNRGVRTTVVAGGIGLTAVLGYLAAATEIGKYNVASILLVPLYSRIKKEKTLDNYIRGQIHGYVLAKPGCHYNQIKQTLNLNNGTLAYHLRKLEKEEFIKSARDGMYKRFYPIGLKIPKKKIKLSDMQRNILEVIGLNPRITQKEVAEAVGISAPAVIYHIGVLAGAKLVKKEKKGGRVRYRLLEPEEEEERKVADAPTPTSTSQ